VGGARNRGFWRKEAEMGYFGCRRACVRADLDGVGMIVPGEKWPVAGR